MTDDAAHCSAGDLRLPRRECAQRRRIHFSRVLIRVMEKFHGVHLILRGAVLIQKGHRRLIGKSVRVAAFKLGLRCALRGPRRALRNPVTQTRTEGREAKQAPLGYWRALHDESLPPSAGSVSQPCCARSNKSHTSRAAPCPPVAWVTQCAHARTSGRAFDAKDARARSDNWRCAARNECNLHARPRQ